MVWDEGPAAGTAPNYLGGLEFRFQKGGGLGDLAACFQLSDPETQAAACGRHRGSSGPNISW